MKFHLVPCTCAKIFQNKKKVEAQLQHCCGNHWTTNITLRQTSESRQHFYFVNLFSSNHHNNTFICKIFQDFQEEISTTNKIKIIIKMPRSIISFLLLCALLTVDGGDSINSKIHMGYGLEFTKKGTLFPSMSTYDIYAKIRLVDIPPD